MTNGQKTNIYQAYELLELGFQPTEQSQPTAGSGLLKTDAQIDS